MTHALNTAHRAVVARTLPSATDSELYLTFSSRGQPVWTSDLSAAAPFATVKEATRMATRLDSSIRAFGLPVGGGGVGNIH